MDVVADHGAADPQHGRAVVGPVDAEDAWSETFLSALRAYPALPADANVDGAAMGDGHQPRFDVGIGGQGRVGA